MAAPMIWVRFVTGTAGGEAPDDPGISPSIYTETVPGPWPTTAAPWLDIPENPNASPITYITSNPSLPNPDVGAQPIVGAYQTYEFGPIKDTGGDHTQAVGRTMFFGTNPVGRYDPDGVGSEGSWMDDLAIAVYTAGQGQVTDSAITDSFLTYS